MRHAIAVSTAAFLVAFVGSINPSIAQRKYDQGADDAQIKVGNTMPYSGPQSPFASLGRTEAAYFKMINGKGGVNGRKINFISYDDAYSPPKTVEQTRRLVEGDEVLLLFGALGTPQNAAVQKYLNAKGVPQLFVASGATRFGNYKAFPWTMGWPSTYQSEGRIFAKYILDNHPDPKIGVLLQNDDSGQDRLKGLRDGLGPVAERAIAAAVRHEVGEPTIDSQIVTLKAAGADIVVSFTTPKATSQAIKKMAELGWKPTHLVSATSNAVSSVLRPAGLENAQGLISITSMKDPEDPSLRDDSAVKEWTAFMDKYYPDGDKNDSNTIRGYLFAQTLVKVLEQCGDDLTRENVMRQAANLHGVVLGMLTDGVTIDTGPADYFPIEQVRLMRFTGERWQTFGPVLRGEVGSPE
ncbi:ABC transporter substrate-binding protein [Tardiphaga sp. 215_C5_N2_1]|uniref:ABC transporter substrate-binding protein n=1 Tax=Tardiphaga sp. 215_C5_N2_1 TaxID=3240774 RepID=UPI003F8B34F5